MHTLSAITEQLLQRAQLAPGMRVLDIGCGSGEVTRALAHRVGPAGRVVGVDSSEAALAAATAAGLGLANIEYLQAELATVDLAPASFDAIVGRRVLMYLARPREVLARLGELLRPGGRLAFQEHDATLIPGRRGDWPQHDQALHWLWETVRREGADLHLGFALAPLLRELGLSVDALWAQAIFAGHEHGLHHPLHELIGLMQQRIVAAGVATPAEIDLPGLEQRLAAERRGQASSYASDMAVCVVASRPWGAAAWNSP